MPVQKMWHLKSGWSLELFERQCVYVWYKLNDKTMNSGILKKCDITGMEIFLIKI